MTVEELTKLDDPTPTDGESGSVDVEELRLSIRKLEAKRDELLEKLKSAKEVASDWERKYNELKSGVRNEKKTVDARVDELERKLEERDRLLQAEKRKQTVVSKLSKLDELISLEDFMLLYASDLEDEELELDGLVKRAKRDRPHLFRAPRGSGTKPGTSVTTSTEKPNGATMTLTAIMAIPDKVERDRLYAEFKAKGRKR